MTQAILELIGIAFLATLAWGIGRGLHGVIGQSSERKRIHGQYIPVWVAGTIVAFGVTALLYFGPVANVLSPPSNGFACFGILVGLMLGTVHGWIRLALHPAIETIGIDGRVRETGNPYEPPSPVPPDCG